MYALVKDGVVVQFPYSATDLIVQNPQTSWPDALLSDEFLESYGVVPVRMPECPEYDAITKTVVVGEATLQDGVWVGSWKVENRVDAADSVRSHRNQLLFMSDWTQLADSPATNKSEWAEYRQSLRDVPNQPGFPWEIQWPTMSKTTKE